MLHSMSRGHVHMYGGRRDSPTRAYRELVPFSDAVPYVYTEVTGTFLSSSTSPNPLSDALLSEVAQTVADLVTIYGAPNEQVPIKPLPVAEVKHGTFQRAANVLIMNNGIEYRRLYIRRADLRAAAIVLKKSGVRFTAAQQTAPVLEAAEVQHQAASHSGPGRRLVRERPIARDELPPR